MRSRPVLAATTAVAGVALAACGGSAARAGRAPAAGRVQPVHVKVDVTGEASTIRTIGPRGGNLAATGRDGTRYRLDVPAGALTAPIALRITPARTVAGLPAGTNLAFGVDLGPHGLVFQRAAWLAVAPKSHAAVRAGLEIDDANIASLQPIGHNARGYLLPVAHFSGTGGVSLPGSGFGPWPNLMPGGSVAGSIQNRAINLGGPTNVPLTFPPAEPPGPPPADPPGAAPGEAPSPPSGSDPDPNLANDIANFLQQQADNQLTGTDGAGSDTEQADLVKRIANEIDFYASQCVNGNDPTKLRDVLRWQARGMALGLDDNPQESERQRAIVDACARFELVLTGRFMFDAPPVFHVGDSLTATVPLEFAGVSHEGSVTAPIDPTGYDRGGELIDLFAQGLGMAAGINVPNNPTTNDYVHCTTTPGHVHVDASATGMYSDGGPNLTIDFATAGPSSVSCDGGVGTFPVSPFVTMTSELQGLGVPEATASGFQFANLPRAGASKPYAQKEIHKSVTQGGGGITIDWTFTINFAPGKLPPAR